MTTLILGVSGARGIVGDGLDETVAAHLARAFVKVVGPGRLLIGRDSRPSGPSLSRAAAAAAAGAGCDVADLGIVPTPTVQVAVEAGGARGGLVVTASHNPPAWNALKFVGPTGAFLDASAMQALIAEFRRASPVARVPGADVGAPAADRRAVERAGARAPGGPSCAPASTPAGERAIEQHLALVLRVAQQGAIRRAAARVVVDAVHGAGQVLIGPLLERLGVRVEWIDGEPDGRLPDRPEPRAERLAPLARAVEQAGADLGFALDPDGDRCALVLPGEVLGEEWTLPLSVLQVLREGRRGPLVANLSTSARIEWVAQRHGLRVERAPVGEAHVVARMKACGAVLGGEGNGGVIDPRVHYGRDAAVAIAHLLGLDAAGRDGRGGVREAVVLFPPFVLVKSEVPLGREALPGLEAELTGGLGAPNDRADGLRWSWPDRWLHVRPSNTEPFVRIFAEAPERDAAEALVARVAAAAQRVAGGERDAKEER